MAPVLVKAVLLGLTFWVSLTSPVLSLTCTSQKLTSADKKPYDRCMDLPVLRSFIRYTYNASNSSLSVAFVAAPAKSEGWIAWAINPTAEGMVGAQALLAFTSNGSPVVKTYNISGYSAIKEGKLSFGVWNLRAESLAGGRLAIHASVKVPEGAEKVNQVWQVGEKVTDGRPEKHAFDPPNLSSKGELRFGAEAATPSPAPATASGNNGAAGDTAAKNGCVSRITNANPWVYLGFFIFMGNLCIF